MLPSPRWRDGAIAAASGLALALALRAAPAAAQTRFEWPDTAVDVTAYTKVDQCLAAVDRVRGGLFWHEQRVVWRDTMPIDEQEPLRPAPAAVTEAAARCAARFPAPSASLADFAPLFRLYLAAGRDADAKVLLDRRLATVAANGTRERTAVSDTAVDIYLRAQPERLEPAEQLLVARARGGADRLDRMELYARLMDAARFAGDTIRARRAAGWVVAVADSLTAAERESDRFTTMEPDKSGQTPPRGGNVLVFGAIQTLVGLPTLLDSLRRGTAAFVALQRNMWARFMNERPEALPLPIGERAPTIVADYWSPREASTTPHPAPGHVAIVEFVDTSVPTGCLATGGWRVPSDVCAYGLSLLHRLSQRFPGLDVTLVGGTRGQFLDVPPPTPSQEAELIRSWIEPYRIARSTIAITTTPFWNLPQPDGRRVDKPTANATAYTFGKSWTGSGGGQLGSYLIDQDGIVVDVIFNEPATFQFIDVLMHRQTGGDRAAK